MWAARYSASVVDDAVQACLRLSQATGLLLIRRTTVPSETFCRLCLGRNLRRNKLQGYAVS